MIILQKTAANRHSSSRPCAASQSADDAMQPSAASQPVAAGQPRAAGLAASHPAAADKLPSAGRAKALADLTDAQLYRRCKKYGANARMWMRKFEGLLPEVFRRRLYKRRGFASIHDFAGRLAGMSREKVDRILQLSVKLEDKPILRGLFESGETGYGKIEDVVYVATPETESRLAEMAKTMSHASLTLYVQKEREKQDVQNNRLKSPDVGTFGPVKSTKMIMEVDIETQRKFFALKARLEKETGEALSCGEVLAKLLNNKVPAYDPATDKKRTINRCPDCVSRRANEAAQISEVGRYVPREVRDLVLVKQNYGCARKNCLHPPTELHHIGGFAVIHSHDPYFLEYLCKKHHREKHINDKNVQKYLKEKNYIDDG